MSNWVQVTGSVRLEGLNNNIEFEEWGAILQKKLGVISTWDNYTSDTILPLGSEGSLEYHIIKIGDDYDVCNTLIAFTGSLRDLNDINSILNYLSTHITQKNLCYMSPIESILGIRDGVLTASDDWSTEQHNFTYHSGTDSWIHTTIDLGNQYE